MADYFTLASDGIVRAHVKPDAALKRIRRGGKVQIGGRPEWYGPEMLQRVIDRMAAQRDEMLAKIAADHNSGKHESAGYGTFRVGGCQLCTERAAARQSS